MSASTDDRSVFPALAAPPQASRWPEVGAHLSAVSARAARLLLRSALALALPLAIFGLWWLATASMAAACTSSPRNSMADHWSYKPWCR